MKKKSKKKTLSRIPRDPNALSAKMRTGAGPMREKTKKEKRNIAKELLEGVEYFREEREKSEKPIKNLDKKLN